VRKSEDDRHGFIAVSVPEPSTFVYVIAAAASIGGVLTRPRGAAACPGIILN
jgi:hypothetical protein